MKKSVIRQLLSIPSAALGIVIIVISIAVAVLGANLRPDQSKDANRQNLAISKLRPLSVKKFLLVPSEKKDSTTFFEKLFFGGTKEMEVSCPFDSIYIDDGQVYYTAKLIKTVNGQDISAYRKLDLTPFLGVFPGELTRDNQEWVLKNNGKSYIINQNKLLSVILKRYTRTRFFLLGTDSYGRDLLSRILGGTIVSLSVGVTSVLISLILGVFFGAMAGYYGSWIDKVVMWFVNVIWSVPSLLMVIAITVALGKGFTQVFIAVGCTMWVEVARVVRGQFMQLREKDYVMAARLMGFSHWRIIVKHMLPGAVAPLIVISAGNFSSAILLESGLSFLGIGAQVPMPSWGGIIKAHFSYITTDYAYLALIPGFCLSLLTLAFMLLGNGIRDVLDVRNAQA